ncbi:MAG TPA: hypothetical protein VGY91_08265, partial [Chthoniobacterales bacterium]|nr:hypothetical protein [Chthoniobacterales bacterium]
MLRSKWAVDKARGAEHPAPLSIFLVCTLGLEGSMEVGRDVTDEQRGRRPIFIATLRAGASWPFFCVALSARM